MNPTPTAFHRMLRALALPLTALALLAGCQAPPPAAPPEVAADPDALFRADVVALHDGLTAKHAAPFTHVTRAAFLAEAERVAADAAALDDAGRILALRRLAAMLGDAHTQVVLEVGKVPCATSIPVRFIGLADGVFVDAVPETDLDLLGARVLRVGDVSIDEAVVRIRSISACETDAGARTTAAALLKYDAILRGLGIVADTGHVTLTVDGGVDDRHAPVRAFTIAARSIDVRVPGRAAPAASAALPPGRRTRPEWQWHEFLADDAILYCRYDRGADPPGSSVAGWTRQVAAELDARMPRAVVVDLRDNGGGNSGLLLPLVSRLRTWVARAPRGDDAGPRRVYALIGPSTFSSGITNALDLKRFAGATLVGEEPGQAIGSFGEVRTFTLPHSGLTVSYGSTVRDDPTHPVAILPDLAAPMTSDAYFAGRDPALEVVRGELEPGRAGRGG